MANIPRITYHEAEQLAADIQARRNFAACRIDNTDTFVKAMPGNTFGIIGITGENRPDEMLSWQRLENIGARLHAGSTPDGKNFYAALINQKTMLHQLIYGHAALILKPDTPAPQVLLSGLWDLSGL